MEEIIPCAMRDQEVFRRVWQRVMAGRSDEHCPVEAFPEGMEGDLSCACLEALTRQNEAARQSEDRQSQMDRDSQTMGDTQQVEQIEREPAGPGQIDGDGTISAEQMAQESAEMARERDDQERTDGQTSQGNVNGQMGGEQAAPEPSLNQREETEGLPEADGPDRGNDLPRLWEEPQESSDRTARLRRQVMEALEGWQFYRHLAKRARGNDARTLNALASETHQGARKLSAAYFLLTGVRYWPSELLGTPAISSYWGALRNRYQAEQRQETAFRMAGDDWQEPSMIELYQGMAEGCQNRSRQLRTLLEQDHMT